MLSLAYSMCPETIYRDVISKQRWTPQLKELFVLSIEMNILEEPFEDSTQST